MEGGGVWFGANEVQGYGGGDGGGVADRDGVYIGVNRSMSHNKLRAENDWRDSKYWVFFSQLPSIPLILRAFPAQTLAASSTVLKVPAKPSFLFSDLLSQLPIFPINAALFLYTGSSNVSVLSFREVHHLFVQSPQKIEIKQKYFTEAKKIINAMLQLLTPNSLIDFMFLGFVYLFEFGFGYWYPWTIWVRFIIAKYILEEKSNGQEILYIFWNL